MDPQTIYNQYVEKYGYPPKQPAHLQSFAKQNNMKLTYAQARNAINGSKNNSNDNNTNEKKPTKVSTSKSNTDQSQNPPTDSQQPINPPPQEQKQQSDPKSTASQQPVPNNQPNQQPNNTNYNNVPPAQPTNNQQQYNYNQWQQYNQYNQYNAQQYNMQQYNPYAYGQYNNMQQQYPQQQNWHQQQYSNQYNSYAQTSPHMSPQTSPVQQPQNQYNNQYNGYPQTSPVNNVYANQYNGYPQTSPHTSPRAVQQQQQNWSLPPAQQQQQQPDIPPAPAAPPAQQNTNVSNSNAISTANKIHSGYNNTYKSSHYKTETDTHLHKNTELDLDFVAELEKPEENEHVLLRKVSPMSNGKYSEIDDITLNNKLETMMNNMGMPDNAKSTIRNQSKHQKIQMIIQYEAQFSTGNKANTMNQTGNISNNNSQSQQKQNAPALLRQVSPMSNEKYANIDEITLNQKLEDMMNKMGMPETAKNATRKQTRQQKIQMILQFERQFEAINKKTAPKKSKYADATDYFLATKFEGFLNAAQIHIVKRKGMRELQREKKIQLIDQYESRKGFIQPAAIQKLNNNNSTWTDHSKGKVGRDFLGMSEIKKKQQQSKNVMDYSIPSQQKPSLTVNKNKLPMKQWNGKNSTSPTTPVSPGGTRKKKKLFKLF